MSSKHAWKGTQVERPALQVSRTHKTTDSWHDARQASQLAQTEPGNNHSYTDAWFMVKATLHRRLFNNCAGTIESPYGKTWNWTAISQYISNQFQMDDKVQEKNLYFLRVGKWFLNLRHKMLTKAKYFIHYIRLKLQTSFSLKNGEDSKWQLGRTMRKNYYEVLMHTNWQNKKKKKQCSGNTKYQEGYAV